MIAGRGRNPPCTRSFGQLQQFVERTAFLIGGGELEVLELQPHSASTIAEGSRSSASVYG